MMCDFSMKDTPKSLWNLKESIYFSVPFGKILKLAHISMCQESAEWIAFRFSKQECTLVKRTTFRLQVSWFHLEVTFRGFGSVKLIIYTNDQNAQSEIGYSYNFFWTTQWKDENKIFSGA